MKRKLESAYHYLDYLYMLNEDFLSRTTSNNSYSLRAYSRDLEVSPGFLSEVLRGQKDLRLASGIKLFSKLGFEGEEIVYIENLIKYKTSPDAYEREVAGEFIRQHHRYPQLLSRPEKDGYIKTFDHFVIYGITRRLNTLPEIQEYASQLDIKPIRVLEVLKDMIEEGYVRYENGQYFVTDLTLTIRMDDKVLNIVREQTNMNLRTIRSMGGMQVPDRVAQVLILGLDKDAYEQAGIAHKHFVQHLNRLAAGSKQIDRFAFVTQTFLALEPSEKSDKKDN